jgi:hypothetical protein
VLPPTASGTRPLRWLSSTPWATGFAVTFNIGAWVDTAGKDTAPEFATFVEAQAIAEKYGDALS